MITEDDKKDSSFLNGNNPKPILLIESIDTDYDDTSDIEFDSGSEIFSVDLKEGLTLRDLYQYLLTIPASERVKIVARVYDWTPEVYSVWMQYAFPVVQLDCSWCDA